MYVDSTKDAAQKYFELGKEHQNKAELERATEYYQQAVATFPQHTAAWLQLAEIYVINQEFELALDCYQSIVKYESSNSKAYNRIAKLSREQGDIRAAIATFAQAIRENSNRPPWFYVQYGDVLTSNNQIKKAIASYKKAIELYPNHHLAYGRMGKLMVDQKQFKEGLGYYQTAFEITAQHPIWIYISYVQALKENGLLDRAIDICKLALKQDGENYRLYCHLGQIQAQNGAINDAITSYKKAIRLQPGAFSAYKQLGDVFRQAKYLDQTIECYQKALEINPQARNVYRLLGNTFVEADRDREAQYCYAKLS